MVHPPSVSSGGVGIMDYAIIFAGYALIFVVYDGKSASNEGMGQSSRSQQLRNSDQPRSDHADVVGFQTIRQQIQRNHRGPDERRQVVGACARDWRGQHAGTVERPRNQGRAVTSRDSPHKLK